MHLSQTLYKIKQSSYQIFVKFSTINKLIENLLKIINVNKHNV